MHLLPREEAKLLLTAVGGLAQRRLARGVRLNLTEATGLLASVLQELIRDGNHSVAELMALGELALLGCPYRSAGKLGLGSRSLGLREEFGGAELLEQTYLLHYTSWDPVRCLSGRGPSLWRRLPRRLCPPSSPHPRRLRAYSLTPFSRQEDPRPRSRPPLRPRPPPPDPSRRRLPRRRLPSDGARPRRVGSRRPQARALWIFPPCPCGGDVWRWGGPDGEEGLAGRADPEEGPDQDKRWTGEGQGSGDQHGGQANPST